MLIKVLFHQKNLSYVIYLKIKKKALETNFELATECSSIL